MPHLLHDRQPRQRGVVRLTHLLDHPDASVYYGSWAEWGMRSDTEVATA